MSKKDRYEEDTQEFERTEPMRLLGYIVLTTFLILFVRLLFKVHSSLYQSADNDLRTSVLIYISLIGWIIKYTIDIILVLKWQKMKILWRLDKEIVQNVVLVVVAILATVTIVSVYCLQITVMAIDMFLLTAIYFFISFMLSLYKIKDKNYSGTVLANIISFIAAVIAIISVM